MGKLRAGAGSRDRTQNEHIEDNAGAEWKQFWKKLSPRLRRAAGVAFADGKIGHRFRPLTAKEQRMLQRSMELHPGLIFHDDEGRAIGGMICPCECCPQRTACFVMETGVELQAQQKRRPALQAYRR